MSFICRILLAILAFAAATGQVGAVVLDWDAITWTPGSLSNAYDIDPAKTGNDVTVTVSGSTNRLSPSIFPGNPQTPVVTTQFAGGLTPTPGTLNLALDLTNSSNQLVSLTLAFSNQYVNGVYDLVFTIFDVDYSNAAGNMYQDRLSSIIGTLPDGTQVAPTITTSANNVLIGSGLSQVVHGTASTVDSGAGSGGGNVVISFGNVGLRSFTFSYGSSTAFGDPTYQHVGFYDFSYSPVPEVNPVVATVLSCLAAGLLVVFHRERTKARR